MSVNRSTRRTCTYNRVDTFYAFVLAHQIMSRTAA